MRPLPMLATPAAPFDADEYSFEVKWDGVRALAAVRRGRWELWGRGGVDYTARYPELAVLGCLPAGTIVDGELVVLRQGRADLPALLGRHQRRRPLGVSWPMVPVSYVLFDLLQLGGQNLFKEALVHRRARLQHWLAKIQEPLLVYSDGIVGSGREFFAQVVAQGHEGVMTKKQSSGYWPGRRSPAWRKIKPLSGLPCAIVGYQQGRHGLEHLLLAAVRQGTLHYVGRVSRGLRAQSRAELARRLSALRRPQPLVPCPERACWVEPELYCRVQFRGWTIHGHLRHAVFGGLLENLA